MGNQVRDWIDVRDHVRAIWWAYTQAPAGEALNIGANQERSNPQIANHILELLPDPHSQITHIFQTDQAMISRYANETSRLEAISMATCLWPQRESLSRRSMVQSPSRMVEAPLE